MVGQIFGSWFRPLAVTGRPSSWGTPNSAGSPALAALRRRAAAWTWRRSGRCAKRPQVPGGNGWGMGCCWASCKILQDISWDFLGFLKPWLIGILWWFALTKHGNKASPPFVDGFPMKIPLKLGFSHERRLTTRAYFMGEHGSTIYNTIQHKDMMDELWWVGGYTGKTKNLPIKPVANHVRTSVVSW